MKSILFACLTVSTLAQLGCSDELKKEKPAIDPRIQQLATEQVAVRIQGLDQPNSYQVELEWPEAQGTVRVSEHSKTLGVVSGSDKKFVHAQVSGGSELSYLVEQLSSDGRITASIPVFVKIPTDLYWDGNIELKDHQKIDAERVFISSRALVTTFDKNLTIVAKEFISDGGVIQNFTDVAEGSWEKNGRSGGTVTIMAKKARGTLQVHLIGEGGGHGKNGVITDPSRHPGCAGTTGGNGGSAGSLNVNFEDGRDLNISYDNKMGRKGIAGVRGSVPYGTPDAVYPPCDRDTPNGVDGQPGGKGQVCLKMTAGLDYVCAP